MSNHTTTSDAILPCGHPTRYEVADEQTGDHDAYRYCGECALIELAQETREAIAAGDEMWAGEMAERAVRVARKLAR